MGAQTLSDDPHSTTPTADNVTYNQESEIRRSADGMPRCEWAGIDSLMVAYHDEEWGVPCHDDGDLFERLILEGFQAGLSWSTILRKRQAFIRAFDAFDPAVVAKYGPDDVARLLDDAGIVRNRVKVAAAISNAQASSRPATFSARSARTSGSLRPDARGRGHAPGDIRRQRPNRRMSRI